VAGSMLRRNIEMRLKILCAVIVSFRARNEAEAYLTRASQLVASSVQFAFYLCEATETDSENLISLEN
jgi:hypothetical protein